MRLYGGCVPSQIIKGKNLKRIFENKKKLLWPPSLARRHNYAHLCLMELGYLEKPPVKQSFDKLLISKRAHLLINVHALYEESRGVASNEVLKGSDR